MTHTLIYFYFITLFFFNFYQDLKYSIEEKIINSSIDYIWNKRDDVVGPFICD